MAIEVRQVVTGIDENGKSVFVSDTKTPPVEVGAIPGSPFYLVWGTDGPVPQVGKNGQPSSVYPFFPEAGGTRFLLLRWAPASHTPTVVGDPDALFAEAEDKLPGLLGAFEADHPKMHTTDSIDYGFCVEGEMWLELDDGEEVHLTPGTCVIQRGTRHGWHSKSDEPALMLYVLVGANRSD